MPCAIEDHPRSRGNNRVLYGANEVDRGSPPLAREQRPGNDGVPDRIGITPARAGTTETILQFNPLFQDHPRSRGNNCAISDCILSGVGSPPLAREQPMCALGCLLSIRITPARAGTTRSMTTTAERSRDHPRSRGNNPGRLP